VRTVINDCLSPGWSTESLFIGVVRGSVIMFERLPNYPGYITGYIECWVTRLLHTFLASYLSGRDMCPPIQSFWTVAFDTCWAFNVGKASGFVAAQQASGGYEGLGTEWWRPSSPRELGGLHGKHHSHYPVENYGDGRWVCELILANPMYTVVLRKFFIQDLRPAIYSSKHCTWRASLHPPRSSFLRAHRPLPL
jgi:hypothetical protein